MKPDNAFFSLGYEFWCAAKLLSSTPSTTSSSDIVTYYLSGHAAELFLKAFLANKGVSADSLKKAFGHDLRKLVSEAKARGLDQKLKLAKLERFSEIYASKLLEYREAKAVEFPPLDSLNEEIDSLYAAIFDATFDFQSIG